MNDENNKKFWDKFAKLYAPFMKRDKGVYDKVCEYICPYLNRNMNALELACGSGQLSFYLSKYTKSWIGTDFSEKMILEAKKHGEDENLTFEIADATALSFANGEFDCVVIANALHIMPKTKKSKQEDFYNEHTAEIILFESAKKHLKEHLGESKTLAISKWKSELATLKKEKKSLYSQILEIREEVEQAEKVKTCIEQLQENSKELTQIKNKDLGL